jgi:nucleotidyltransferase substrate binding protein (TIGR01987 family)
MDKDIRWKQRFGNYRKALAQLVQGIRLARERQLSALDQLGLVKGCAFTYEVAWYVMKDYLTAKGFTGFMGSKDTFRMAFKEGLIEDGQIWMDMVKDRNLSSHTYDEKNKNDVVSHTIESYCDEFCAFQNKMEFFL